MKYILMRLFSSTKLYEIKNPSTEGTRNEHGNMRNMETNQYVLTFVYKTIIFSLGGEELTGKKKSQIKKIGK